MPMQSIELAKARSNNPYRKSRIIEAFWLAAELLILRNPWIYGSRVRIFILRCFGAKIARGVFCPWPFRVFMPWNLCIGANSWIGDGARFHNQAPLLIGANVVISQDCFVTTGTHDHRASMDLVLKPVEIQDGVWLTSRCFVQPGVKIPQNVLVLPSSVVFGRLEADSIYAGNPLRRIGPRFG
jgi:putative colanic acid biosynthesis acetyltransferase WcaF